MSHNQFENVAGALLVAFIALSGLLFGVLLASAIFVTLFGG